MEFRVNQWFICNFGPKCRVTQKANKNRTDRWISKFLVLKRSTTLFTIFLHSFLTMKFNADKSRSLKSVSNESDKNESELKSKLKSHESERVESCWVVRKSRPEISHTKKGTLKRFTCDGFKSPIFSKRTEVRHLQTLR